LTDLTPGSQVGPYTVVETFPTGQGGMAVVCKAAVQLPNRPLVYMALKVMRAGARNPEEERFFSDAINNEVQVLKQLLHPNIVRIYPIPMGGRRANPVIARDTSLPGSPWFFVMEYLEGGSLQSLLRKNGRLSVDEAAEIACQMGLALAHMHGKGIAHRDVKPDNVLFRSAVQANQRIEPVLVDFGIAAKLERIGLQAGSIYYMSPERLLLVRGQLPPERVTDQSAGDVYGLAAVLYQMLTGRRPFEGKSQDHITTAILNSEPTLPRKHNPEIPPEVEQLIMDALSKAPIRRPSAEEFVFRLEQLVPAPRIFTPATLEKTSKRGGSAVPWAISAFTTLGFLGLLGWNLATGSLPGVGDPAPEVVVTRVVTATESAPNPTTPWTLPPTHTQMTQPPEPTRMASPTWRATATATPRPWTPTPVPTKPSPTPRPLPTATPTS